MKYLKTYKTLNESLSEVFTAAVEDDMKSFKDFIALLNNVYSVDNNGDDLLYHTIVNDDYEKTKYLLDNFDWNINKELKDSYNFNLYINAAFDVNNEKIVKSLYKYKNFDIKKQEAINGSLLLEIWNLFGVDLTIDFLNTFPDYDWKTKNIIGKDFYEDLDDGIYYDDIEVLAKNVNNKELKNHLNKIIKAKEFNL